MRLYLRSLCRAALAAVWVPQLFAQAQVLQSTRPDEPRFLLPGADPGQPPTEIDPLRIPAIQRRIVLSLNQTSRTSALRAISQASGLSVVYESQLVDDGTIHLRADSITIATALVTALSGTQTDILLAGSGSIIIVAKPQRSPAVGDLRGTVNELRGIVRDSASHQPIVGAVVTLIDSSNTVIGRIITGERGQYHVPLASPVRHLRVQRLGFRLRSLDVPRTIDGVTEVSVDLVALPSLLDAIQVVVDTRCPRRKDSDRAFALLQQARAGLLSFVVARDSNPVTTVRLAYKRHVDVRNGRILDQEVRVDSSQGRPVTFRAVRTGADFASRGFRGDSASGGQMLGPDAEILLDDGFAGGYCFRIVDPDAARPNQIGLGFGPADRRRGRVDIDGTLWMDTVGRRLVDIDYRYVGLGQLDILHPGGNTSFREVRSGVVIVDRWVIRMPVVQVEISASGYADTISANSHDLIETGGEVARARWAGGLTWRDSLGRAGVHVRLEHGKVAAGELVGFTNTDYFAVVDSSGNGVIEDLLPGPYKVSVADPSLPEIDLARHPATAFVAKRDSTASVALTVRTLAQYTFDRCDADHRNLGNVAMMVGLVQTADGQPGASAAVTYGRAASDPMLRFNAGRDGVFALCLGSRQIVDRAEIRVRGDGDLQGRFSGDLSKDFTVLRIPLAPLGAGAANAQVTRRDLLPASIGDSDSTARGTIVGVVSQDKEVVANARILTAGVPEVRTGADGRFVVRGVPAGTRQIEVRAIGMVPVTAIVDVVARDTAYLDIRLGRVTVLDSVRVTAEAKARQGLVAGFLERKRTSYRGYFRDSTTIGKNNEFSGVFIDMPSVSLVSNPKYGGFLIEMRSHSLTTSLTSPGSPTCDAEMWVDRVRIPGGRPGAVGPDPSEVGLIMSRMRPQDIAAIEVYLTSDETPAEFGGGAIAQRGKAPPCGTVVIWTKRGWP